MSGLATGVNSDAENGARLDAEIPALRADAAACGYRIAVVGSSLGDIVVKGQRPARSAWRARGINALARAVGLSLLQSVPVRGGSAAQAIEVARLQSLWRDGIAVPELLHVADDFFVMRRLVGRSLIELVEAGGPDAVLWWRRGMRALADVHRRGQYLSQAFARNFIATDAGLAMIDFEDDPREVMSLAAAQARDWLAYLHSTAFHLRASPHALQAIVAAELAGESDAVRALVEQAGRRLAWLRHLPTSRRPWGREVIGLQALAALFHRTAPALAART